MPRAPRRHPQELLVRDLGLSYPEAHEDFPWGHRAIKVRAKVFVIMSNDEPGLSVSVKLPWSAEGALQLPSCEPTHYGMGRSGWVTATYAANERAPLDALRSWIDESYRAIAPKRLVAKLEGDRAAAIPQPRARPRRRRPTARGGASARRKTRGA